MSNPIPYRIHCSEIWGGIQNVDVDLCTRGVSASLYSAACGGERGGDIYYLAVCSSDLLTRVVIADLRGHGLPVSELSRYVYEALQLSMDTLDGTVVLNQLNRLVHAQGFQAITTALVAGFYVPNSTFSVCYAGHPPALIQQQGSDRLWNILDVPVREGPANLPLGVLAETEYDQIALPLIKGDRFALYTDGVTECSNIQGAEFGVEGLRAVLQKWESQELATIKQHVLAALGMHMASQLSDDDVTVLLVEVL